MRLAEVMGLKRKDVETNNDLTTITWRKSKSDDKSAGIMRTWSHSCKITPLVDIAWRPCPVCSANLLKELGPAPGDEAEEEAIVHSRKDVEDKIAELPTLEGTLDPSTKQRELATGNSPRRIFVVAWLSRRGGMSGLWMLAYMARWAGASQVVRFAREFLSRYAHIHSDHLGGGLESRSAVAILKMLGEEIILQQQQQQRQGPMKALANEEELPEFVTLPGGCVAHLRLRGKPQCWTGEEEWDGSIPRTMCAPHRAAIPTTWDGKRLCGKCAQLQRRRGLLDGEGSKTQARRRLEK